MNTITLPGFQEIKPQGFTPSSTTYLSFLETVNISAMRLPAGEPIKWDAPVSEFWESEKCGTYNGHNNLLVFKDMRGQIFMCADTEVHRENMRTAGFECAHGMSVPGISLDYKGPEGSVDMLKRTLTSMAEEGRKSRASEPMLPVRVPSAVRPTTYTA